MLHDFFNDGTKSPGPRISFDGLTGNGMDGAVVKFQFHMVHGQEFLVLTDKGVLRFRENLHKGLFIQRMERNNHRETADKFGNEAEFQEILRLHLLQELCHVFFILLLDIRTESHDALGETAVNDLVNACKGAAADEEDIGGVNLDHFLVRMLPAALGRYTGHGAFQNLQQGLLHPFAGYIPGDGGVFRFPCDFIDFIDIDNAPFRLVDIVVRRLDEAEENVFHVFPYIAGFRKGGGVGDGKGHIQETGQGLGKECLAAAGGPQHDDVGFLQLHIIVFPFVFNALIVVVHSHGQCHFRIVLFDDILVHVFLDFFRRRQLEMGRCLFLVCLQLFPEDIGAHFDAFVADIDAGAGNQFFHFIPGAAAEAADRSSFIFPVQWKPPLFGSHFLQIIAGQDLVDEAIVLCHFGGHEIVSFRVPGNSFQRLSAVFGKDAVQFFPKTQDFTGMDFDFRSLSLYAAQGLVNHNVGMGQCIALASGTGGQKHRCHAGAGADADGRYIGADILHGIVNGQPCGYHAAGAVDVKMDILGRIFCFQEEELGNDDIGHVVFNLAVQEYDAVLQKAGVNVIGPFSLCCLLNYDGYICHSGHTFLSWIQEFLHEIPFFPYGRKRRRFTPRLFLQTISFLIFHSVLHKQP